MNHRTLVILTLVATGCDPLWGGGTGVGNPGSTQIVTAAARGASIESGQGTLTAIALTSCSGTVRSASVDEALDLLASGPLDVDAGRWCAVDATFASPIQYQGVTASGATFDLTLDVERVSIPLAKALTVNGNALVTELGYTGWVNDLDLGSPLAGENVSVAPGDPLHDLFATRIAGGSALFDDDNENGEVDDNERQDSELGEGPEHENETETDD